MARSMLFTSESVTEGHPDKVADQVSDALLDSYLRIDKHARVAIETLVKTGIVVVAGEVRAQGQVPLANIARQTISEIGYNTTDVGFDANTCAVLSAVDAQSSDIAQGVDASDVRAQGAGDQGMMFGYACDETEELMPAPIATAHAISRRLAWVRKHNPDCGLRPDGKTQVTFAYTDGKPTHIATVLVSTQHHERMQHKDIEALVIDEVIEPVLPKHFCREPIRKIVNPTGRFVIGGPVGDAGLTGRKIIVDTYGGMGRHGGGAFSGKDPSKVDRSAAYYARYMAKNIVAARLAERCEVQLAYAIGEAEPVSLMVQTFGTARVQEARIEKAVRKLFVATPSEIIRQLDLLRPIYRQTAAYGHFGRPGYELSWERTDMAEALSDLCGQNRTHQPKSRRKGEPGLAQPSA